MTPAVLDVPSKGSAASEASEADVIRAVQEDLAAYRAAGLFDVRGAPQIPKWEALLQEQPQRFIRTDGTLDVARLRNFRKLFIFIPDAPVSASRWWNLRNLVDGGRRGVRRSLVERLRILQEHGYDALLNKYPCHPAGNPHVFEHQGYRMTERWVKHIYYLGLLNRVLGPRLPAHFTALDIGSSYGIFPSLVKREYPGAHCVLVDFPEQLLLARYFLGRCYPHARIAGIRELQAQPEITRAFIEAHDFVLAPTAYYEKLVPGSLDLVSNFASLGEMTPQWLRHYLEGAPFKAAKWFFTVNRVQSRPTYDTPLTIVDYPIWDAAKRLHFASWPLYTTYYASTHKFWMERFPFPPYFEYIGTI